MPVHSCSPPKDAEPKSQSLWLCPECGSMWEAAPDAPGIFDFDRDQAVTRAEWILIEGPAALAG